MANPLTALAIEHTNQQHNTVQIDDIVVGFILLFFVVHLVHLVCHFVWCGTSKTENNYFYRETVCCRTTTILPFPSYGIYSKYSDRQVWANSVDPDQMLQNAASDQGLHCLPLIQQF